MALVYTGAIMAVFIGVLLAKITSPDIIALSLIGGFISNKWWHVIVTALVVALLNDFLLQTVQVAREFRFLFYITAMIASLLWAGLAVLFKRWRTKTKSQT